MSVEIRFTVTNDNPDTIWNRLAARLGREPTNAEAAAEVRRILADEPAPEPATQHERTSR
ncbi:hypothetical protein [Methylorubrum extorquens]|uniref:hypothetical protein n=1 Tax=Methylorubrum extorquens TaxID=408 RepID=UPI002237AF21|nr:hypothetical protein [Methylorubrum extorquens]UYW32469.1 hypothetical protein OKB92_26485 [Methylorubrum extorquens]